MCLHPASALDLSERAQTFTVGLRSLRFNATDGVEYGTPPDAGASYFPLIFRHRVGAIEVLYAEARSAALVFVFLAIQ